MNKKVMGLKEKGTLGISITIAQWLMLNSNGNENDTMQQKKSVLIYGPDLWKWHCSTCMNFKLFNTIHAIT